MELEQAKGKPLTTNVRERERERESSEWVSKRFGCAKCLFYVWSSATTHTRTLLWYKKVLVVREREKEREEPKNVKDDTDAFYFYFTRALSVPPKTCSWRIIMLVKIDTLWSSNSLTSLIIASNVGWETTCTGRQAVSHRWQPSDHNMWVRRKNPTGKHGMERCPESGFKGSKRLMEGSWGTMVWGLHSW